MATRSAQEKVLESELSGDLGDVPERASHMRRLLVLGIRYIYIIF